MPCWVRVDGTPPGSADELQARANAMMGVGEGEPDVFVMRFPPEGQAIAIWSRELPQTVAEEPHVQAELDARGDLWAEHFSVACPEGEKGFFSPTAWGALLVPDDVFEVARSVGWRLVPPGDLGPGMTWVGGCAGCGALDFRPVDDVLRCEACGATEPAS